ncbi:MAG: low specificity L-threonine aldolase [Ahrensia sp.]|nr:low specificity L-threonine aldolase [Ahrensia sp.]
MHFASDNRAGVHPKISTSLVNHAHGHATSYGGSDLDKKVVQKFSELFEREVSVFYCSTGTAANALAFSAYNRPGAVGFCHREAHIREDECGAPEFFASGARLRIVDGPNGKMLPENLDTQIKSVKSFGVSGGVPAFVSITQGTEAGTVHTLAELDALTEIAKNHQLPVHMDGARFANAVQAIGCTPAEMTWKRGIDALSFGATKNGCWCAEALIFFQQHDAAHMAYIHKRAAQVMSKTRFVSAQFDAYLKDELWLELAAHANSAAQGLEAIIAKSNHARLAWRREINEVFAVITKLKARDLKNKGAEFYEWPSPYADKNIVGPNETIIRLVTDFSTTQADIDNFAAALNTQMLTEL